MAVVRIKDAPFTTEEKEHLDAMGLIEADWGHPDVVLDDPVKYFKKCIKDGSNPTIQLRAPISNLPYARGRRVKDFDGEIIVSRRQSIQPTFLKVRPRGN